MPDGVVSVAATPDSRWVNVSLLDGAAQIDLESLELRMLDVTRPTEGPLVFPSPAVTGRASSGPTHMVLPTMYFAGVYLYDLAMAEAVSITEWIVAANQPLIPASPTFGRSGLLAGVWTGDNTYLLDVREPEQARVLNGHDERLYSTSFAISEDEELVSYTTYDPADGTGQVLWEEVASGDLLPVVDGTAWSVTDVIPGDSEHFLLFHDGQLERRSFVDPGATGDVLGRIGAQPSSTTLGTADGMTRLISSRRSDSSPLRWQWLDLAEGTLRDLPELDGMDCKAPTPWEQDPRYLVLGGGFDPDTWEVSAAPVIGLDLMTGETFDLLGEVVLDAMVRHTTTADGSQTLLTTDTNVDGGGTWLLDVAHRTAEQFPVGTTGGAIMPEGTRAALSVPGSGGDLEVLLFDPAAPADFASLGAGQVLGWS